MPGAETALLQRHQVVVLLSSTGKFTKLFLERKWRRDGEHAYPNRAQKCLLTGAPGLAWPCSKHLSVHLQTVSVALASSCLAIFLAIFPMGATRDRLALPLGALGSAIKSPRWLLREAEREAPSYLCTFRGQPREFP